MKPIDMKRVYQATHVMVKHPEVSKELNHINDAWNEPMPIVLDTEDHIWVAACYYHESKHPDVRRVGDSRSNGYDLNGSCVLSIPVGWCTFITEEEAESIVRAIEVNDI